MINAYNPWILSIWKGNMDIKIVTSEIIARYITKYCTKEEPFNVVRDNSDEVTRFLETRNYSVHEIAHLLSTQTITSFDTKIVRIPCCSALLDQRYLLPLRQIRLLDADSEDVHYANAMDHYINKIEEAQDLTIIQFYSQ